MKRATFNVSMPASMRKYVEQRVGSGRYGSVSEYFRDLVRRDHYFVQEELKEQAAAGKQQPDGTRERTGTWQQWALTPDADSR